MRAKLNQATLVLCQFFVALLLVKSRRDCILEGQNIERVRAVVAARIAELEASAAAERRQVSAHRNDVALSGSTKTMSGTRIPHSTSDTSLASVSLGSRIGFQRAIGLNYVCSYSQRSECRL